MDALRALLAGAEDSYPRFTLNDLHLPPGGNPSGEICFDYMFRALEPADQAAFHLRRTLARGCSGSECGSR